jgi:hypothetical protein
MRPDNTPYLTGSISADNAAITTQILSPATFIGVSHVKFTKPRKINPTTIMIVSLAELQGI